MHTAAFIGLCFVAWLVGAFVANGISITMGIVYAEATFPVVIGYWLGKAMLKNKQRDPLSIIAFPAINLIAGLFGFSLGHALAPETLGSTGMFALAVAFALSSGVFAVLNKRISASKSAAAGG